MNTKDDRFGAAVTFIGALWISIGIGFIAGFWYGFTAFPILFVAIAKAMP